MIPFLMPVASLLLAGSNVGPIQLIFLTAGTAQSSDQAGPDSANEALFDQYFEQLYAARFDEALKSAGKIKLDDDNRQGRAILNTMKAAALIGLKRDAEAQRLFAEAEKLAPHSAALSRIAFDTTLATERFEIAAVYFDQMIARSPDLVREMRPEAVWHFLRNEPKDQKRRNDDRRVALAQLGYGGEDGDFLAGRAIEILVARGDTAGAHDLLRYIDDPRTVEDMLIQKRLQSIWPMLEERAGARLEKVRATSARAAEAAYEANPNSSEKLHELVNALRHAGRYADAIALRSKLPAAREAMAEADEHMGWAVNNIALALHESKRAGEADRLFALLNEAPMKTGEGRWRVSMIINRIELLVADGKFDQAQTLMQATEASAAKDGNPYAQQLVRRLKFCTLSGLGRKDEAAKIFPQMMAHAKDALHATVDGLICAGELDKAEQLLLEALRGEDSDDFQRQFVRSLQARPLTSDDPSIWHDRWAALRQRPAIAAEFNRLGRDMPEQYLPPPID